MILDPEQGEGASGFTITIVIYSVFFFYNLFYSVNHFSINRRLKKCIFACTHFPATNFINMSNTLLYVILIWKKNIIIGTYVKIVKIDFIVISSYSFVISKVIFLESWNVHTYNLVGTLFLTG